MKGVGDRLPPTLDLAEGPVNGSFSRANSIHLAGTAADEDGMVQGIEISIDSGPFGSAGVQCRGCQEPSARWSYESLSALPDGEHQISVRSFDRAGHRSEAVTRKITVDTQRPALEALASTGGSTVVKASFNEAIACPGISPSAFDVVSGKNRLRVISVACRGEAAEVLNLTLSDPVRGGDQVSVSARGRSGVPADRAGNPSSADFGSTQASNVGPLLTMASRAGRPQVVTAAGVEIVGTAVDPDGTLDAIEVSVDGGAWSAAGVDCSRCGRDGESGWTFRPRAGLAHGKHKLEIRSVDNAGSKSGAGSAGVTVDAVAPSMAAARAEGANSAVEVSFSEPVACNGNAAGQFSARIGGRRASVVSGTCAGDAAQLTVSPSPRGGDKVEVSVRGPSRRGQAVTDVAGNPVSAGGTTVTATNRPPVLQVDTDVSEVFANPGLKPGTKVRVEGTASDPDGQIESVEASVDEGPFSARLVRCRGCGRSQEVTFTIDVEQAAPETRRTVAFRARDGASAFSSPEGSSVASDAQAPVFETISARSGVSSVTAGFSEPIDCTTVDKSSFRVTSNGKARKVLTTLCAGDAQEEVQLRVAGRIKPGETMAVQLVGGLTDPAGNPVQPVTLKGLKVPKGH
ncbi:MAG TPA: Ig-like domain-containing protein, partial [Actinomycetota bacterium]|nr:Ig-like domain-containing protein [Actinomycetota bacterium]